MQEKTHTVVPLVVETGVMLSVERYNELLDCEAYSEYANHHSWCCAYDMVRCRCNCGFEVMLLGRGETGWLSTVPITPDVEAWERRRREIFVAHPTLRAPRPFERDADARSELQGLADRANAYVSSCIKDRTAIPHARPASPPENENG